MTSPIWLYADRLPPLIGGMEMHARYFIEYFDGHRRFPLEELITKDSHGHDVATRQATSDPSIVFFNSGRWIEMLPKIRSIHPNALFVYRTGGNEILKAPLERSDIPNHAERQAFWTSTLNGSIDLLVTNSAFTENRLLALGVRCPFLRCVGGVNVGALRRSQHRSGPTTLFCAARFVPYKQHDRLLSVVARMVQRGLDLRLRLAGDGPLEQETRARVLELGLTQHVAFLGPLDNESTCAETASADIYIQLSADVDTEVPGGRYLHSEGMGRSILEALSAGTFVIAGRSGALPEVVTPEHGLLLDLEESNDVLAEHIAVAVLERPRPEPTDIYSWPYVFARYEQCWEKLLAAVDRY